MPDQQLLPYRGGGNYKPVTKKPGVKEKKFIAYCERFYFLNKASMPTPEQASAALSYRVSEIQTFLANIYVQKALTRRGIPWESAGAKSGELTPTQIAAAHLMMNFADVRSENDKLNDLGVLPATYYAWLNDPVFQGYVSQLANKNLENVRPSAMTNFAKMVREGKDLNALKYYFEVTGEFSSGQVQNLQAMLQMVIEAVQMYVKDPIILALIAQKLTNAVPGVANGVMIDTEQLAIEDNSRSNVFTQ